MKNQTNWKKVLQNLSSREKSFIILGILVAITIIVMIVALLLPNDSDNKDIDKEGNGITLDSNDQTDNQQEENPQDDLQQGEEPQDSDKQDTQQNVQITDDDPQDVIVQTKPEGDGAKVDVSEVVNENETKKLTVGIDVSKYQGTIDWKKVAKEGIDFAMIRVGYRTMISGEIVADSNAKYNMQEAQKNGIKVGVYFFSTAVSAAEAREEAKWVANYIAKYKITYPVAYDCEGFMNADSRQYNMTKTERTDVALAFLKEIKSQGYEGMFYASQGELEGDASWEVSRISPSYKIWVAQYPNVPYPETSKSSYSGKHAMWQYTNQGTISGISKKVDVNIAYFGYDKEEEAQDKDTPDEVDPDVEALMKFTDVNEKVTSKDKTNLRDKPSQGSDSKVIYTLENGDVAVRTGKSDSGWSRVEYKGKKLYAVSSYLTTDLDYRKPVEEPDDGIETEFTKVNEKVTAKEVVNLRQKPSVDDSVGPVVCQLKNGDIAVRTGINKELGWSRVEYDGKTLYCISSYLAEVEE